MTRDPSWPIPRRGRFATLDSPSRWSGGTQWFLCTFLVEHVSNWTLRFCVYIYIYSIVTAFYYHSFMFVSTINIYIYMWHAESHKSQYSSCGRYSYPGFVTPGDPLTHPSRTHITKKNNGGSPRCAAFVMDPTDPLGPMSMGQRWSKFQIWTVDGWW